MQNSMTKNKMNELRKRALQRRVSFPCQKNEDDVKKENLFFDEVKGEIYRQITEDKKWN